MPGLRYNKEQKLNEGSIEMAKLEVRDLHVSVKDEESKSTKEILKGVNLTMQTGEIHAIMGPNGTGKSTLSETIMGKSGYHVTQGDILLDGQSILDMPVDERARRGLFLAMQYPAEVPGVTNAEFLRVAINARRDQDHQISVMDFLQKLDRNLSLLDMKESMTERYLNEGFSGGEKKRNEILQLLMIEPKIAILDEIDSGLDIDALKVVSKGVNSMRGKDFGALIITHYQRLLNYIVPDTVHVMMDGRIVKNGGPELAKKLEAEGYTGLRDELGLDIPLVDDDQ
ncbi:ABC superfamily ATP binding cassette transporter, ABC protein [Limosilactobacillus frumenti DSM 13145]|uniref:ABC superfamily ATP binding cassette transporter, ABC protein n=2 Tax=Limosilactobacillus frumenti TaxID=104955 RepID=A0A0R1PAL6_9LACO|nr:ABC superfamily ATP binding cassette transporter, ABC protein [Limosilactobacillus frumenti DSM 13145]